MSERVGRLRRYFSAVPGCTFVLDSAWTFVVGAQFSAPEIPLARIPARHYSASSGEDGQKTVIAGAHSPMRLEKVTKLLPSRLHNSAAACIKVKAHREKRWEAGSGESCKVGRHLRDNDAEIGFGHGARDSGTRILEGFKRKSQEPPDKFF
jgi:hypothetical protein